MAASWLHCIIWHCIVLYCMVLHCIVLSCIVLLCFVRHCIILHGIKLHCITLHCMAWYGFRWGKTQVRSERKWKGEGRGGAHGKVTTTGIIPFLCRLFLCCWNCCLISLPSHTKTFKVGAESKRNTVGAHLWRQPYGDTGPLRGSPCGCLHTCGEGTLTPVPFPPEMQHKNAHVTNTWQPPLVHARVGRLWGGENCRQVLASTQMTPPRTRQMIWTFLFYKKWFANDKDDNARPQRGSTYIYTVPLSSASAVSPGLGRFGGWFRLLHHQNLFFTVMVSVCPLILPLSLSLAHTHCNPFTPFGLPTLRPTGEGGREEDKGRETMTARGVQFHMGSLRSVGYKPTHRKA